jgi:hypothetical protein
MKGLGTSIPPLKEHVIIYFLEKGGLESDAVDFYQYFNKRKWKNKRYRQIANWKAAAWNWILKLMIV